MAPKRAIHPSNINTSASSAKRRHGSNSSPEPSSPTQPRDRRRQRPRDLAENTAFGQSSYQAPVDPLLQQSSIADSPRPSSEGTAGESSSRRQSTSSTMRTPTVPFDGPPTSTPTGRISKAKKGKRVHACSYEGCGKIFTRAEHRRRHELNHNPEAMFPCTRPGCRKAFHRLDLLQRHQERHDLEHQLEQQSNHARHITQHTSAGEIPPTLPTTSMASPPSAQGASRTSGGLSIGSLVHPQTDYRYNMGTPAFTNFSRPSAPYSNGFTSSDDSLFYTPESSQSPVSEQYGRYHRQSISSSSSVAAYDPHKTSPLMNGTTSHWMPATAPPNVLPANMFEEHSYIPSHADTSVPIPLTNLDGDEFDIIRRELSHAPGIIPANDGTGIPDAIRWDCLEHYWQNFHPYFPVVHRPTFLPTKPSPLLASAMVAIGSQFDHRSDAKQYSLILLEVATRLLRRRDSITSRSRLSDLQTVFLLEALSKFFARRIEVEMSARFRALFASLDQARRTLATSSLAVFRTLRKDRTKDELNKAHKFWVDHETRRRILQAFSILDMQQMVFFEQAPTIIQHTRTRLSTEFARTSMALPCAQELWDVSPIEEWENLAKDQQNSEQLKIDDTLQQAGSRKLDHFQMQAYLQGDSVALQRFFFEDECFSLPLVADGNATASTVFNKHAMTLAKCTPLKSLLIVSGESWVFGKKLENEAEFQRAKQELRNWINLAADSMTALWHALALLRSQISLSSSEGVSQELTATFRPTKMLHEPWCIYLATLVCWAHGLYPSLSFTASGLGSGAVSVISAPNSNHSSSASNSGHPSLMDPNEAAQEAQLYLNATRVATPADLTQVSLPSLGRIHGLLETVRMKKILPLMGGLMCEAERVLYRLVEGRSTLSHF